MGRKSRIEMHREYLGITGLTFSHGADGCGFSVARPQCIQCPRRRGFMLKASSTPKPRSTPARVALKATVPLRLRDSGHRNTRLPLEALSGRSGTFPGPGPTDCAFRPTRIQEFFAKRYSRRGGIDEDLASFSRERWEFASMMRVSCR